MKESYSITQEELDASYKRFEKKRKKIQIDFEKIDNYFISGRVNNYFLGKVKNFFISKKDLL